MKHQRIIVYNNIALVPTMEVYDSSIVEDSIDGIANCLTIGCFKPINPDICR